MFIILAIALLFHAPFLYTAEQKQKILSPRTIKTINVVPAGTPIPPQKPASPKAEKADIDSHDVPLQTPAKKRHRRSCWDCVKTPAALVVGCVLGGWVAYSGGTPTTPHGHSHTHRTQSPFIRVALDKCVVPTTNMTGECWSAAAFGNDDAGYGYAMYVGPYPPLDGDVGGFDVMQYKRVQELREFYKNAAICVQRESCKKLKKKG